MTRASLTAASRGSAYRVDGLVLLVGRRPLWSSRAAVMLTAHNPLSRRHAAGWNARMLRALDEWLRRHPWREAVSGEAQWRETQRVVEMDTRAGRALARRFRQNAMLVLKPHQPPRLVILAPGP